MTPRDYAQHFDHSQPLANLIGHIDGHAVTVFGEELHAGLRFDDACLEYERVRRTGREALAMLAATLAKRDA